MTGVEPGLLSSSERDRRRTWNCRSATVPRVPQHPFSWSRGSARRLAFALRKLELSTTAQPMKTKSNKITDRSARKVCSILAAVISWLLLALILIVTTESSFADSGIWVCNAKGSDGDWNFNDTSAGTNWAGGIVPNGPGNTATFNTSDIT